MTARTLRERAGRRNVAPQRAPGMGGPGGAGGPGAGGPGAAAPAAPSGPAGTLAEPVRRSNYSLTLEVLPN